MTGNQVKNVALLIGVAVAGFVAVNVYNRFSRMVQSGGDMATAIKNAIAEQASAIPAAVGNSVTESVNAVKSSLGLSTSNADFVQSYTVKELPFSRWSQSAIDGINAANRLRGITRTWKYAGDFAGWKVYSDGTCISPDGYYLRDLLAAGEAIPNTDSTYQIQMIPNSFSGLTFDQTRYQWQEQPSE